MTVQLGTAPDSWGVWFPSDEKQIPWRGFLNEVAELGYSWIELGPFGYLPSSPDELLPELGKRGLKVAGSFFSGVLEDGFDRASVVSLCKTLQACKARYLSVIDDGYTDLFTGAPLAEPTLEAVAWNRLVKTVEAIAEIAEAYGLTTLLHPHAQSHVETEEQIEAFLTDVDQSVGLLLDVGHHAYCGGDPVEFVKRHHARIPYLHLKSVDVHLRARVENEGIAFAQAVALGVFVEPELGTVDFTALRAALDEVGFSGFGIVEQDMYPAASGRPKVVAQRTRDYLLKIGFGELEDVAVPERAA